MSDSLDVLLATDSIPNLKELPWWAWLIIGVAIFIVLATIIVIFVVVPSVTATVGKSTDVSSSSFPPPV